MTEPVELPYSQPPTNEEDIEVAVRCLRDRQIDPGAQAELFQQQVAEKLGVPAAWVLLTSSCTAALHAAAVHLRPTVVKAPVVTWPGSYCWAPNRELLDVEPATGAVCVPESRRRVDGRPMLVYVELWGRPIWPEQCTRWMSKGYRVVIDAAHNALDPAHGKLLESGAAAAVCYSFGPIKQLTTMRGGALVAPWAAKMQNWRDYGGGKNMVGTNADMTEVGAAMGVSQLKRWDWMQAQRQAILRVYAVKLDAQPPGESLEDRVFLATRPGAASGHLAVVTLPNVHQRERVRIALEAARVRTRIHYGLPSFVRGGYPGGRRLEQRVLTLPCHTRMTVVDAARVADVVLQALSR